MASPVDRIRKLKEREEDLWQEGAFSQGDVSRQQEINNEIESLAEKAGVDPSKIEGYDEKLQGETSSGGSVDVGTTTLSDPGSGETTQAVIVGSEGTDPDKSSVEKVQEAARDQGAEQFAENVEQFQQRTDTAAISPQGVEGIQLTGTKTVEEKRQIQENQERQERTQRSPSTVRPDTREVDTPTAAELFRQRMNQGVPDTQESVRDFLQARERNPLLGAATPEFTEAVETRQENLETQQTVQQNIETVTGLEPDTKLTLGTGENQREVTAEEAEQILKEESEDIEETIQENEQRLQQETEVNIVNEGAATDFFNPFTEVSQFQDLSEEAEVAGRDLAMAASEIGEQASDLAQSNPVTEDFLQGPAAKIESIEQFGQGLQTFQQGRPIEAISDTTRDAIRPLVVSQTPLDEVGLIKSRNLEQETETTQEAAFGTPADTAGFFTAVGGGSVSIVESSVQESSVEPAVDRLASGIGVLSESVSENPGRFAKQEVVQEATESALTLGLAPITPTVTPSTPSSVQTAGRFVKGDLGFRAEDPTVVTQTFESGGPEVQRTIEQVRQDPAVQTKGKNRFRQTENGRIQEAIQVDPQADQLTVGQRVERPLSRREFLKERLGLSDAELSDFIEPNAIGAGPGAFVPPETTSSTSTETVSEDLEMFQEPETPESPVPDTIEQGPGRTVTPIDQQDDQVDQFNQEISDLEQQEPTQVLDERQGIRGSPTADIDEDLTRGTVSRRLTVPAPESNQKSSNRKPEKDIPEPPTGTEIVNEPETMFTRRSSEFEPPVQEFLSDNSRGPQTFTPGPETDKRPEFAGKPLEAGVMGLTRGQTPLFRVEETPSQALQVSPALGFETTQTTTLQQRTPSLTQTPTFTPTSTTTPTPTPGLEEGEPADPLNPGLNGFEDDEEEPEFAPDLASAVGLGNVIRQENVQGNIDEETFTGVGNRPLILDEGESFDRDPLL